MQREYTATRDITVEMCPWLDEDIPNGAILYEYWGATYGCIGPGGIAMSFLPDQTPFFEVPYEAVELFVEASQ